MTNRLLHTPEGVRDIYGLECARKLTAQQKILEILNQYGYQGIETPTFEYFDIFKQERGSVVSREMFKFFDRENETLVLRPDMTPAISRCVAKYFMDEDMPIRLCYLERTFINTDSYQGRLKEATQTGAELIGDDSSDADAEMVAMVIDSLKAVGLQDFQVELGQVEFFRGLLEEAGMDETSEEALRELIQQKNFFGVEELLDTKRMKPELKALFLKLPQLFGSIDQILPAKNMTSNKRALAAIDRLETIYHILSDYGLSDFISFDLGMLSKYQYYTGLIFKAYTYGTGDYIVNGGRYDKLLAQFGKQASAVGFGIIVDQLMLALVRQDISLPLLLADTLILYDAGRRKEALSEALSARARGGKLLLMRRDPSRTLAEYAAYAKRNHIQKLCYYSKDQGRIFTDEISDNCFG